MKSSFLRSEGARCLFDAFVGFCALNCSMDFMSYFRSFALENPQNRLKILPRLDFCESKIKKIRHCEAHEQSECNEAIQITRIEKVKKINDPKTNQ